MAITLPRVYVVAMVVVVVVVVVFDRCVFSCTVVVFAGGCFVFVPYYTRARAIVLDSTPRGRKRLLLLFDYYYVPLEKKKEE